MTATRTRPEPTDPARRRRPPQHVLDAAADDAVNQGYTVARNPVCERCREQRSLAGHCACD